MSRRKLLAAGAVVGVGAVASGTGAQAASAASRCEPRYLGYRAADEARPYAKYMKDKVDPPQANVGEALAAGPVPVVRVPSRATLAEELNDPGYAPIETGYGQNVKKEIWVACLTQMPRVTPAMWDWWFGWHSKESARYKLWHPEAHAYAALQSDKTATPGLTDRERYVNNISYVDEIIGGELNQLAINFKQPRRYRIDGDAFGGTVIAGTVGTALAPVNIGMVFHQVRPVEGGSEMRSRFFLNVASFRGLDVNAVACAVTRGLVLPRSVTFNTRFGAALMQHCGEEMNHLAQFLPELYAEFGPQGSAA